ncbi:IclR family transcriptional regulator [Bacilliculturomica massiliensis]|uniref:IclR family transcriptional regulator n=1 Tax=Bacilliculturomica massiliensis TaxID=1917867 RepID=UPI0010315072|nr:IclR family transcriptional regulator [Bacilliculturomica massiliensis]
MGNETGTNTTNNLFTLTLLKAVEILNCFDDDCQEVGIKEIAELIHMPQSSVYRIMQSLEFTGFIFQNKKNKKYRMGPKVIRMARSVNCMDKYMKVVMDNMKQLNEECGETINLGIADCDRVTYIYRVESKHLLRPNYELNARYPAYSTGMGKVFLADMSKSVLRWVYDNNTAEIGGTFEDFWQRMEQIRKLGFAVDDEEFCAGLRCVASPVRGPGGNVIFSVSVSAPTMRMPDDVFDKTRAMVMACTQKSTEEILQMGL